MTQLILVEGIPGSGKSTTAKRIEKLLTEQGKTVLCFQEGDLHPCDLAWHACVPNDVYKDILSEFNEIQNLLNQYSMVGDNYTYVAYTKVGLTPEHPLHIKLESYEIYGGTVSLEAFKEYHFLRWKAFAEQAQDDTTYIFECAFLQNHLVELILTYQMDDDYIIDYIIELIDTVENLNPELVYLSPINIEWVINNAVEERKSDNPEVWKDWIDMVIEYVEGSKYGKTQKATGLALCLEFFKKRQALELDIIKQLPIKSYVHQIEDRFTQTDVDGYF